MKKYFLIFILILASFLRFYKLSSFSALNADEAALGYNAYSLLLTGYDEHGHPWPVNLESFGDFKPAGYAYLLIPFVRLFGLTELAVRLPSAIFGVLAVFFIYLLTREIINENCALLSALFLAISPWHLHFSRGGWEVNVATTLILIGVWLFARKRYLGSAVFMVLSMYVYQSARIIAPILGLALVLAYRPKKILPSALLAIILLLPLGFSILHSDAGSRLAGVGLLADEGPVNRAKELRGQHSDWNSFLSKVFHNRPVLYSIAFLKNYTDHFSGDFLFVNGDVIPRNKVPETGLLYFTDFVFVVLGIVFLIRKQSSLGQIVWLWLLIAPLAAALTFQTPHALRAQNMVIPITILIALGIYSLKDYQLKLRVILALIIIPVYMWQFARYLHEYYVHYPQAYPTAWEYGFKQLVPYVESVKGKYNKILVTDKYDQPYILFLFYSKYPPQNFQGHHTLSFRDKFNFSTVRDYDKYHFADTPWSKVRDIHSSLIVAAPEDIPDIGVNIVKTINFPNGQPAFKIISN